MKLLRWLLDSMARTYTALLLLLVCIGVASAAATQTTSWDVTNNPQMFLDVSITGTQTTNIKLSALTRNGATVIFPNMTGGVLRIRQGSRVEDLSFTGATVNSSTKVVTLAGVTRNICWNDADSLTTCGDGLAFSKGSIVELSVDARLLNFKVNKDRANILTANQVVAFSGSGSFEQPNFASEAERDRQIPSPQFGMAACVSGTGLCYDYIGGVWTARGDTGTSNATTTSAGKVETATVANISGAVITDDSGAPVALTTDLVIRRSTGAINNRNKIVATNNDGYLSGSLLPQLPLNKFNNGTNASSTTFWRGDGTWATSDVDVLFASGSYAAKLDSNSAEQNFNRTYSITANSLTLGGVYEFVATGTGASAGATHLFKVKMGTTELCRSPTTVLDDSWSVRGVFTVQATGGTGKVRTDCHSILGTVAGGSGSLATIDTTAAQTFQVSNTTNATAASAYAYLTSLILRKLSP